MDVELFSFPNTFKKIIEDEEVESNVAILNSPSL
jgi:hypothetical protein